MAGETNQNNKDALKAKMGEYLTRVETLRGMSAAAPAPAPGAAPAAAPPPAGGGAAPPPVTGGGDDADDLASLKKSGSGGSSPKKEDDENSKFREGLSSVINTESPNVKWDVRGKAQRRLLHPPRPPASTRPPQTLLGSTTSNH